MQHMPWYDWIVWVGQVDMAYHFSRWLSWQHGGCRYDRCVPASPSPAAWCGGVIKIVDIDAAWFVIDHQTWHVTCFLIVLYNGILKESVDILKYCQTWWWIFSIISQIQGTRMADVQNGQKLVSSVPRMTCTDVICVDNPCINAQPWVSTSAVLAPWDACQASVNTGYICTLIGLSAEQC